MKVKCGLIVSIVFCCYTLITQVSDEEAKVLLKIIEKIKELKRDNIKCLSIEKIRKIVRILNTTSSYRRNKAYRVLKKIIHCENVKNYLEKKFNSFRPMVKYLIINAAYETGEALNLPLLKDPKKNYSEKKINRAPPNFLNLSPYYLEPRYIFERSVECESADKLYQLSGWRRGGAPSVQMLRECNSIILYKNMEDIGELLEILYLCTYNFVSEIGMKMYKYRENNIKFKKIIVEEFQRDILNIAIVYFSRYNELKKADDHDVKWVRVRDNERFLYIQGIILYFLVHILNKSKVVESIVTSISNNDILLLTFLSLPISKSKIAIYYLKAIINKLSVKRIISNILVAKGYLCLYKRIGERMCKDKKVEKVNFLQINPFDEDGFKLIREQMRKCLE